MLKDDEFEPQVIALLDELKPVPARNHQIAAQARAKFLAEAVSVRDKQRHSPWTIFQQKEQLAMKLVLSTLVIVGLLFAGNATVAAAQDDLPNQPLYQLKLMSEDVNLWFVADPVQQIDLLMKQEQVRIQEMQTLAAQGVIPPADGADRAQERIQRALQIAAQLDETSRLAILQQIRTRLQTQEQQMLQLEQGTCTECIPVLKRTQEMLQLHLGNVEDELPVPGVLQNHNQNQNQTQMQNQDQLRINQTPWANGTAMPPYGTCTPALDGTGQQNGSGSPAVATPVRQQNQNGEGNQNGPGSGSGNQNGSGSGGGGSPSGSGGQGGKP